MIVYSLRCENSHEFEGWFRSGASFDAEVRAGEHECPECGSTAVEKAPMAPAVAGAKMSVPQASCPMTGGAPACGGCGCFPE